MFGYITQNGTPNAFRCHVFWPKNKVKSSLVFAMRSASNTHCTRQTRRVAHCGRHRHRRHSSSIAVTNKSSNSTIPGLWGPQILEGPDKPLAPTSLRYLRWPLLVCRSRGEAARLG